MEKMNISKSQNGSFNMRKILILLLAFLVIFIGCESDSNGPNGNGDDNLPTVTTAAVKSVTQTTAV